MTEKHNRRTFVKLAGSASVVGLTGLAGCSGDGGDGSSDGSDGSDGGDGSSDGSDGSGGSDGGDDHGGDDHDDDHGGSTDGGDMKTITLGGSMSLSGDNANLGQLYRDSYDLTIQRINESGGVEAGDGNTYELEMELRDDGTDPSTARGIYQELITQESIDYLLGPYASSVTLPASAVAAANQKPMVEGGGASPEIFSQGNEWIFGLLPTADRYALSTVDMAMSQDSAPSSAAILAQDDTFSQFAAEGVKNKIEGMDGLSLDVNRTFPTNTSDLSTELGEVRSTEADLLLLCAHQRHATIAAGQLESQDINVDLAMSTVGSLTDSFKEETGPQGNYWYGPSSWATNATFSDAVYGGTQDYVSAVQDQFDYMPDYHSAAGATVIETFAEAFRQVDEVAPTPVRDAIRDIEFTSLYGDISFADNGVINKDMLVYQWQPDAGKTIVYPESVQQNAPVYPMPDWSER
ncbi:MAG: branched-chain amino acid transport system substrate-binding protein [Haloarculaceae archaeon]|jgi:branched-chain amino acid transport system substrate-binding protein